MAAQLLRSENVDYKFDDSGTPVPTDQGRAELTATWRYITSPPYALFDTVRSQEFATVTHVAEEAIWPSRSSIQRSDSTVCLRVSAGHPGAVRRSTPGVQDIVLSRRPLSDLDGLVGDWRTAAGDKMRGEYLDAMATTNKS